jgi:hypothetical protein
MNTASLDYAVVSSSVATELESLRAEKQLLAENIRKTELRLNEISSREEKLARLSESLTDLLTIDSAVTNIAKSINIQPDLPPASDTEQDLEAESSSPANESALAANQTALNPDEEKAVDDVENASTPSTALSPSLGPETVIDGEFDKTRFFEFFPYLKGAQQPIHVLAEKVLEYMNRPLKLKDLTRYVLELGYRHHSQNFTNSIHTVLKHKRDRNGSFYFDPKQRVWELGHWQRGEPASKENKTIGSSPEIAQNPNSEPPDKQKKTRQRGRAKSSAKAGGQPKIKVIKSAGKRSVT